MTDPKRSYINICNQIIIVGCDSKLLFTDTDHYNALKSLWTHDFQNNFSGTMFFFLS